MLQTEDLFLGAFGLVRGGELVEVEIRGQNGRRMAVFHIEGPAMDEVQRDYHRGASVVDLRLLKSEVTRLKNIAFQALREERPQAEPPYRPSGIHSREGGRTRTRSAEDAAVGAFGAAQREEEKRHAGYQGRDRADQGVERAQRSRR